ncbi:hypothetical protein H632_c2111p0 [Helicosporidium sp. ATCC 50920]|nr:hypothetical protein H632_c2111p0 [Helicosporidium sp. ATCC 50920]|eukprot:KDD73504.1 hypothetical protein H632_c2111p0 [Helicosporidium sp. ATCC 50920]
MVEGGGCDPGPDTALALPELSLEAEDVSVPCPVRLMVVSVSAAEPAAPVDVVAPVVADPPPKIAPVEPNAVPELAPLDVKA